MEPENEYHLRISQNKNECVQILTAFTKKFKVNQIVSAFEHKGYNEDGSFINPHSHSYIKYGVVPSKQSISDFFKKQALLKDECQAGYSHVKQKTSRDKNLVYVVKQKDIILNTIGDIQKWIDLSAKVDDEKKMPTRDKLYLLWVEEFGITLPTSKFAIYKWIDELYVLKWKKNPLSASHLFSYSKYLIINIYNNLDNKNYKGKLLYEDLLRQLNNIKMSDCEGDYKEIKEVDEICHLIDRKRDELNILNEKVEHNKDVISKQLRELYNMTEIDAVYY